MLTDTHYHHLELKVQGRNLNSFLRKEMKPWIPKLTFLKVDSEGYDYAIIQSLKTLIQETKPIVLVEFLKKLNLHERQRLYDTLVQMDYKLYSFMEEGPELQGPPIEREKLFLDKTFDAICSPNLK